MKMMTVAQDRKKAMLAVCLCLLAISVTYRLLNPYRQETVASPASQRSHSPAPKADLKTHEQASVLFDREVRVELFLNPPIHSGMVRKNVFQKQEESASTSDMGSEESLAQPNSAPEVDMRLQVQEELSKFKTFGYLQGKEEKVLFLERGKDILMIREGDRLDGKYLVKTITEKLLIIRAESIGEDVRIELTKF